MKREVFNQYVALVTDLFRVNERDLFKKSKKREYVDARHMLYYLCATRPMRISWIQGFMSEKGYDIAHSSIIHGVKITDERVELDKDYASIVKRFEMSCEV